MKFLYRPLFLAMALASFGSLAQTVDLGPDISPMRRFQLYPRIDKALEAMARGDGQRAIAELRQAQQLAPENTAIALYLADAYRRFGQPGQAEAVLKDQLRRAPGDLRLSEALRDLRSGTTASAQAVPPAPPAASAATVPLPVPDAAQKKRDEPARVNAAALRTRARPSPGATANTAPAPAANPGYEQARQAYAEVARGDAMAALPLARQAVQAAPEQLDYQRLLVYLLIENGRFDEAESYASHLESRLAPLQSDPQWRAQRQLARQRAAFGHFEAARQARERGDMAEALRQAAAGTEQAPDVPAHRLQWISLLLQSGDLVQAQRVAEQGLAKGGNPALQVLLGAALQAQGRSDAAGQAFDAVLAAPALAGREEQNYRVIAADAALAARRPERAERLLEPLARNGDPGVAGREAEVQTALRRVVSPASLTTPRFRLPVVNCFGADYAPGCEIWPGQDAPDPAREAAQQAYQAYAEQDYNLAARKAEEAAQLNAAHLPYQLLRLQALAAAGRTDQALQEAGQVLQKRADASEVLALRSRLRHDLGQEDAASADARAALQAGGLSLSSEVDLLLQLGEREEAARVFASAIEGPGLRDSDDPDLAYLAVRVGDDRTALTVFNRARTSGRMPVTSLRDGAYTASRLAENNQAVDYFQKAIDAVERDELHLPAQALFATRREVADRTRAWGASALLGYRGISPGSVSAQPGLYGDVAQVVGEAFWRPQKFGDGRFWELYGGLAQTVYSRQGDPTGGATTQGAIGIRAKPFSNHNFVLSAERRIRIGSLSINDWLLRAGYSGGTGTDLRVDVPSWTTVNVYAEAGRFLQRRQNYATFEAQAGRSFRMGDADSRLVLFPHAVLGVDYNSQRTSAGYNGAAGAGLGIGMRYWFREDRYNAPRSYLDLSLQYRARLLGDERGKGVFLRAALVY